MNFMKYKYGGLVAAMLMGCLSLGLARASFAKELSFLHASGQMIVDKKGERVQLRGVNLGNWLLIEPWMNRYPESTGQGVVTEKDIWDDFSRRFGRDRMQDLMQQYRAVYITEKDIKYLKSLGVNFVRVPIWWRVLADPTYAGKGFGYLDDVVDWCEKYQIYCLIDMHGAPGGQNDNLGILGERPQVKNGLWKSDTYVTELEDVWEKIAARYQNRAAIAGYDLLNEAWGCDNMIQLASVYDRVYRRIRKVDPQHMIFLEDALKGMHRMPQPKDMGWENIVYSTHMYSFSMEETTRVFRISLSNLKQTQKYFNVPFHIGEFNTIQMDRGGIDALKRYMEIYDQYGWAWNVWSYKKLDNDKDTNWGFWGLNPSYPVKDLSSMSYDDVKKLFQTYRSSDWPESQRMATIFREVCATPIPDYLKPDFQSSQKGRIILTAAMATLAREDGGDIRMEWQFDPPNIGYWKSQDSILWDCQVPADERYEVVLKYASPAEKAQVELWIDGYFYSTFGIKNTGGWAKYGAQKIGAVFLKAGRHQIRLRATVDFGSGFANVSGLELQADGTAAGARLLAPQASSFRLSPYNLARLDRKNEMNVEWSNNPPNFGYWSHDDRALWDYTALADGNYHVRAQYATPDRGGKLLLSVNDKVVLKKLIPPTGSYTKYELLDLGTLALKRGANAIAIQFETEGDKHAGNFRYFEFEKQ